MLRDLDTASKLNRDPSFIRKMMAYGEEQAEKFLAESSPLAGARYAKKEYSCICQRGSVVQFAVLENSEAPPVG